MKKEKENESRRNANQNFRAIAEAYEVLSDEELKGKYDRGEEINPQAAQRQQQQQAGVALEDSRLEDLEVANNSIFRFG